MNQVYINPKHISKIEIIGPRLNYNITWQDEIVKKYLLGLWIKIYPAGYYEYGELIDFRENENKTSYIFKDKLFYYKPYIQIYHTDGTYTSSKGFENEEEAKQFYNNNIQPLLSTNTYISL